MPWRVLVDEDTDERCVDQLVERGFDAESVASALGKGALDPSVVEYARREGRVLVTTDRDFLDPDLRSGIRVLLVADDTARADEITDGIVSLARLADDPTDLKPVTWI